MFFKNCQAFLLLTLPMLISTQEPIFENDFNCCCPMQYEFTNDNQYGHFFIKGEALYWRATEGGLSMGGNFEGDSLQFVTNIKERNLNFKWDWGFKLGLGWIDPCCNWDIAVNWIHFTTKAKQHAHSPNIMPDSQGIIRHFNPAWMFIDYGNVDTGNAKWKLKLDVIDAELGYKLFLCNCFHIRPLIGVRFVRINQDYDLHAEANRPLSGIVFQSDMLMKCDFPGAGLRGGVEADWDIYRGFKIFGSAALSGILGKFHFRSHQIYNDANPNNDFTTMKKDHYWDCVGIFDTSLGLAWKTCALCDKINVTFQVAWEMHLFLNQNRFEDTQDDFTIDFYDTFTSQFQRGNLCTHGLTFGGIIDF